MSIDASPTAAPPRERARPLPPDERRSAVLERVIPLLQEHGRDVSTRQIAEACGVAEGTVFRAFGDKETLIAAAVESYFDPRPFEEALDGIDRGLPVEQKLAAVVELLLDRFTGIVGLMSALGMRSGPPPGLHARGGEWISRLERLLEPDLDALSVAPATIGHYLRLVVLATSVPQFSDAGALDADELLRLVMHGVLAPERRS